MNVRLQRSKSFGTPVRPIPLITPVPPIPEPLSNPYIELGPHYWHALLIGITYTEHEDTKAHLDEPHNDVHLILDLLISRGWFRENITILSDEKPSSDPSDAGMEDRGYLEPTKCNILNALKALVRPALEGEHAGKSHKFFFYYAGHGAQEPDPTGEEEDLLNECIVPLRSKVVLPSDCKFDMKRKQVRRSVRSSEGAEENITVEQLLAQPTEDHGWINDDTMCNILCRPLPENCRLRAFFDMCHSGTALDLEHNYTWVSVPDQRRWRFNWQDDYLPPNQRRGTNWLLITKLFIPKMPSIGSSVTKSRPGLHRAKSSPRALHFPTNSFLGNSDGAVTKTWRRPFKGVRRVVKDILLYMRRPKSQSKPACVPETVPSNATNPLRRVQPIIVIQETDNEDSVLLPLPVDDMSTTGDLTQTNNLRPDNVEIDRLSVHTLGSDMLLASSGSSGLDIEVHNISMMSLDLPPTQPLSDVVRRRTSSAPSQYAPFSKNPIKADVVCLGASTDRQLASDTHSLAKLLVQLYRKISTKKEPANHQVLLWITRKMKKGQIPQLSSSRDLSEEWDAPFLI